MKAKWYHKQHLKNTSLLRPDKDIFRNKSTGRVPLSLPEENTKKIIPNKCRMNYMKKISKRKILLSNICKSYIIIKKKDNDDDVI